MRKLIVTATLAALGVALLATPASASFDHHFRVIEKASFHPTTNGYRFRGKLFQAGNRDNRVGRDHGRCTLSHHAARCHGIVHLNGEIGGFGDIAFRGNIREDDNRLNVVGGSHDFDGVAGKILLHNRTRRITGLHFDLVR
jgi:hypothetical protein